MILLTYNPRPNRAEQACLDECARIAAMVPQAVYQAVNVPDAKCKTDGVNAALAFLASKPRASQPELICFMDADIIFKQEDALANGIQQLHAGEGKISAVSVGRTSIHTGSFLVAAEAQLKHFLNIAYGYLLGTGWMTGAFLLMRFELALKYGFDRHCLNEDNDMLVRMAADGHCCLNPADIVVMTEAPPDMKSFLTQRTRWAQGATDVALCRLPLALAAGSLGSAGFVHRAQAKTRWILFWIFQRTILKYMVPLLLPAFIAVALQCQPSCENLDGLIEVRNVLYQIYFCLMLLVITAAAVLDHQWLKWWHFFLFAVLRVPLGIFLVEAAIVGDAQHFFSMNMWIETARHQGTTESLKCTSAEDEVLPDSEKRGGQKAGVGLRPHETASESQTLKATDVSTNICRGDWHLQVGNQLDRCCLQQRPCSGALLPRVRAVIRARLA